ncbi:MAG: transporter substrate-binding domain-containing protein [Clostridia bacterium]|nr:transporter substrate-binding domain-containing protein [Clostridia bacterium]
MKKILALILAALMVAVCFAGCSSEKKELVIGYTDYAPMNYTNDNGELVGFDTEFAKAVCEKLGYTAKFQLIDWNNKYMELDSGAIDCIWNGFTYNCADDDGVQRGDKVSFTYAYMNNEQCVVVKKDNLSALNSADALAGKKVSAENGSAGEGCAKTLMGDNGTYIGVTAQMNTLTELSSGNVDFVVIDKTMANSIIGKGDYSELAIADKIEIESEQYAVGFKKGSELTEKVNGAIKELAADGTLAELAEKYGLSNYLITEYN